MPVRKQNEDVSQKKNKENINGGKCPDAFRINFRNTRCSTMEFIWMWWRKNELRMANLKWNEGICATCDRLNSSFTRKVDVIINRKGSLGCFYIHFNWFGRLLLIQTGGPSPDTTCLCSRRLALVSLCDSEINRRTNGIGKKSTKQPYRLHSNEALEWK